MSTTNGAHPKVVSPSKLAHVVLRTSQLDAMLNFYVNFLGGRVVHHNPGLAFMTYDDEHHRIAFINIPDLPPKVRESAGLEHIAFTFNSLTELFTAYKQRLEFGVKPVWCTNHGPTTSMYYKDLDGNILETQYDNFGDDNDATNRLMEGPEFAENPIGVDFDPEEMWAKLQKEGEDTLAKEVMTRGKIGPRGIDTVPMGYLS